jgi:hypothetical protein
LPERHWALPAASARQAGSRLPGAPVTRDAVVAQDAAVQPQAAERAGAVLPAERGAAEAAPREAWVWEAELRPEAAAVSAGVELRQEALRRGARDAAAVLLPVVPGAPAGVLPSAERPSGAAWVCHRDQAQD